VLAEDRQTLFGLQPISHFLFDDRYAEYARTHPWWRTTLMLLWRLVTALILQFCWATRTLLIPGFTLVGTVITLINVDTVMDVILNSTAIGFVLEIDDVFYEALIPFAKRVHYEEDKMPRSSFSALTGPAAVKTRSYYVWLLLLLNIVLGIVDYLLQVGDRTDSNFAKYAYYRLAITAIARAVICALAEIHSHLKTRSLDASRFMNKVAPAASAWVRRGAGKKPITTTANQEADASHSVPPSGYTRFITFVLISAASTVGSAFFVYCILYNQADGLFGFAIAPSLIQPGSTWEACLFNWNGDQTLSDRCNAAWQGTAGLSYFATEENATAFRRYGRDFAGLKDYYAVWWQLSYAAYYE